MTDEDAAFAAAQWASGIKQREIAGHFGLSITAVSTAIERFLNRWLPPDVIRRTFESNRAIWPDFEDVDYAFGKIQAQGDARRNLVPLALSKFLEHRRQMPT